MLSRKYPKRVGMTGCRAGHEWVKLRVKGKEQFYFELKARENVYGHGGSHTLLFSRHPSLFKSSLKNSIKVK